MNRLALLVAVLFLGKSGAGQDPVVVQTRVVDAAGEGIEGVKVRLTRARPREPELEERILADPLAVSAADGALSFEVPQGLDHFLWATKSGWVTTVFVVRDRAQESEPGRMEPLVMRPGVFISGTVQGQDGEAIPEALVQLRSWRRADGWTGDWISTGDLAATRSGSDGTFTLQGAPSRVVRLLVGAHGFHSRDLIVDPAKNLAPIGLTPAEVITGIVRDAEGEPAPGAFVVWGRGGGAPVVTDEEGRFEITRDVPAFYPLAAAVGDIEQRKLYAMSQPTMPSGGSVELVLERPPLMKVTAAAPGGEAVDSFRAYFEFRTENLVGASPERYATTTEDGVVEIPMERPPREDEWVLLHVDAEGFAHHVLDVTDRFDPRNPDAEARAVLVPESRIEGRVTDAAGDPVADCWVWAMRRPEDRPRSSISEEDPAKMPGVARTGKDGRFAIRGLPAASYHLFVSCRDLVDPEPLEISLGSEEAVSAEPRLQTGASLELHLGAPLPEAARIVLDDRRGGRESYEHGLCPDPWVEARRLAPGHWQARGLAERSYEMRLLLPGSSEAYPDKHELGTVAVEAGANEHRIAGVIGTIRGTVRIVGVDGLSPTRFELRLVEHEEQEYVTFPGRSHGKSVRVEADGSFTTLAVRGDYRVEVVDRMTGLLFHREAELIELKPGGDHSVDLEVVARSQKIEFEGGRVPNGCDRLEALVDWPLLANQIQPRGWEGEDEEPRDSGLGWRVHPGQTGIELLLPARSMELVLRMLTSMHSYPNTKVLARLQVGAESSDDPIRFNINPFPWGKK